MSKSESICRKCFHSYVCEQFNKHRDDDNQKCRFNNDHFVSSEDVVKVVRCKDCKYYYCVDNKTRLCTNKNNLTLKTALTISREHYCSYGELKELK